MIIAVLTGLIVILSVWLTGFVITFRRQISCMVGMMSAMTLGMTVGLVMGTFVAVWLPGQFFQSTLISMLIGCLAGVIIGWPISLMAIMDGLLSGIMGGMMGAMLMFMMPAAYITVTVKIMAILCSGILFLLFILLQGELKAELRRQKSSLFAKPISMFMLIIAVLGGGLQLPISTSATNPPLANPSPDHANTGHHHAAPPGDQSKDAAQELYVAASEFSFSPNDFQIHANQRVRITLANAGQLEHDFEIVGTDIHVHAAAGEKNSQIVLFEEAGTYEVRCTLPGHRESGMTATIRVNA
ncbi:cupredoxin domain-containing protein [Paenibacillus terrigena]|uniref:cupredoxin domain-containing protein n=1 Tax=Paenibacillus terrigena TaxID=369333 RepID=UPI0028D1C4B6|nr:cupredoxin domain-containing protein [Paenibacillus terrigena]